MLHKMGMTASVTVHFHCIVFHKMKVNGDRGYHSVQHFLLGCTGGEFASVSMTIFTLFFYNTYKTALVLFKTLPS